MVLASLQEYEGSFFDPKEFVRAIEVEAGEQQDAQEYYHLFAFLTSLLGFTRFLSPTLKKHSKNLKIQL